MKMTPGQPAKKKALMSLRAILTRCWQAKITSPEDEAAIAALMSKLELLNEEARTRVGGDTPLKKAATFKRYS